jgi:hypothetical protein
MYLISRGPLKPFKDLDLQKHLKGDTIAYKEN